MPPILLAALLAVVAVPLWASPCEVRFRAGVVAYLAQARALRALQAEVYGPAAWVSATHVLARLEAHSALTGACEELALVQARIAALVPLLERAESETRLAVALCFGINRDRATDNLAAIAEAARVLADEVAFLDATARACRPP